MQYVVFLLSSFFLTYFLIKITFKNKLFINIVDSPNKRKKHLKNTPAIGGVLIFISLLLFTLFFIIFDCIYLDDFNSICFCTFLIFTLGFIDDICNLNVFYKLSFQIIICAIAILMIDFINQFYWPVLFANNSSVFCFLFSLFFMLIIINGINFLDGLDGLLSTLSIVMLISYAILFESMFIYFFCILIGSLLAFLKFNKPPAKIFLGDSGSLLIGWFLVLISFYYASLISIDNSMFMPLLILLLPIIDLLYVILIRFYHKDFFLNRFANIFIADRQHIHYKILNKTNSSIRTVFYISLLNFLILIYLVVINFG